MTVLIKKLVLNVDKEGRGFEIQGMQKSNVLEGKDVRDIVLQTIRPYKIRGNHRHLKKTEWFLPIRGSAVLCWWEKAESREKEERHTSVMKADFESLEIFQIEPETFHSVANISSEDFYMLSMLSEEDISDKEDYNGEKKQHTNCEISLTAS